MSDSPFFSIEAAVRAYYGLSQRQLGAYLNVSNIFIAHLEAGRKSLPLALQPRLLRLAYGLPAPHGVGVEPPAEPPLPPLDTARPAALPPGTPPAIERRYRTVALALLTVSVRLDQARRRRRTLTHRAWGLAQLPAAFAAADAVPGAVPPTAAEIAHRAAWLAALQTDLAAATRKAGRTTSAPDQHLLAARVAALRAELAALAAPVGEGRPD